MITVLVHYKQWVDSGNAHFDDTLEYRSKVVEVAKLTDLNDLFRRITKIELVNTLTIPVVVNNEAIECNNILSDHVSDPPLCEKYVTK